MANPQKGSFYGTGGYRSREGLTTRSVSHSDEVQLRIDPIHGDLDEEITGLHRKITQLKSVAQEIESEAKFQNDFISQLIVLDCCSPKNSVAFVLLLLQKFLRPVFYKQMTLIKAQAGVKSNMRRLNRSIIQQGSNHLCHVILFAFLCLLGVYFLSKFLRR